MFSTKFLRIAEGIALGCIVVCEVTLSVMAYKNNERRDIEAHAQQNKTISDAANRVVKLFEDMKTEQGAA